MNTEESTVNTEENEVAKKKAKKVAKKTGSKKLDGKALAAKRKPRDTVAQYVKDELEKGKRNVDKILAGALDNFPGTKATRGYVRFIAKGLKIKDLEASEKKSESKTEKAKAKAKKPKAKKSEGSDSPSSDPAS